MSSVSTAFKVHYNQKLGGHPAILGGGTHHGLWGDRRPCTYMANTTWKAAKKASAIQAGRL